MNHPKSCPPHVRVVFCDGCTEYVELAGIVCNGPHLGDAACATVAACPRCEDFPIQAECGDGLHGACPVEDRCGCACHRKETS